VSNLLFFRRSLAYRHTAIEIVRKAGAMPPGSARAQARRLARALVELARTEAWLEGQRLRPPSHLDREQPGRALSSGA
jgi:hypothetical protein